MNHTVSDFIIRLKNSSLAQRRDVELPYSNLNKEIAKVLVKENYLEGVKEKTEKGKKVLLGTLKYDRRRPYLSGVKIHSNPSLRVYMPKSKIRDIEIKGRHVVVLSTSKGVMTGNDARKKGVGGEILFEIW